LERRLEVLSGGRGGEAVSDAELQRRMRRLQGEDENDDSALSAREERKDDGDAMEAGDEVETMLRQINAEVKLDFDSVQRVTALLSKPLSASRDSSMEAVAVDDPHRLMAQLQSLPSTEVAKLRQQRGRRRRRRKADGGDAADNDDDDDGSEDEEGDESDEEGAKEVDEVVRQAMDEARLGSTTH
jgi:hypothetical protein